MVLGVAELQRRFRRVPALIEDEMRSEVAKVAAEIVSQMQQINPYPDDITIGWTWDDAPAGSVALAQAGGGGSTGGGNIRATIYAQSRLVDGARVDLMLARIVEFGTGPRRVRSTGRYAGVMPAQPYFFPVFRANRGRARNSTNRALRRALKKA